MFESFKSREELHNIVNKNREKAKRYGERISNLRSYDQYAMSSMQINKEIEKCNYKMRRCEKRIQRAEQYL